MKHIKVLGITGGVGAGKSTILNYLEEKYHAKVIQLDQVAHLLMEPGQECYDRVVDTFGSEILNEDGSICRPILYEKTFGKRESLDKLNKIVHPMVKKWVKDEIIKVTNEGKAPFIVLEAALLLEDHYDVICDQIWFVYVKKEVRIARLQASRGYTLEKIEEILRNQRLDEEFREFCQFEVDNSSDILENTYEQMDRGLMENGFL